MNQTAYRGDPELKQRCVEAATRYLTGTGTAEFPADIGWPHWLKILARAIARGLPYDERHTFELDSIVAVQVGADLDAVQAPFLKRLQQRNRARLRLTPTQAAVEVRDALEQALAKRKRYAAAKLDQAHAHAQTGVALSNLLGAVSNLSKAWAREPSEAFFEEGAAADAWEAWEEARTEANVAQTAQTESYLESLSVSEGALAEKAQAIAGSAVAEACAQCDDLLELLRAQVVQA